MSETNIVKFNNETELKVSLHKHYKKQIENYFGDESKALKFLSSVVSSTQRLPKLMECTSSSLINSFIMMAELELMPSGVSGEAYVLPYMNRGVMEAQFQLGYQGLVTLFYRAGVTAIYSDIVREHDGIEIVNGNIVHKVDPRKSNKERGKEIGAYVVITFKGSTIGKYMHADDIIAIGQKFSKSYNTSFTPWKSENDLEKWMWKKTVLKQMAKLLPKNETINRAIAEDNKDSNISDRLEKAQVESNSLKMGNLLKSNEEKDYHISPEENQEQNESAEGPETINPFKPK
jgi:recombination protein RecT